MAELCAPEDRYVFRTGDLDQAQLFLGANGFTFEVAPRERKALDLFIDSEDLQNTSILYMQRGASSSLTRTTHDSACGDYWIVLPIREAMEGVVGGSSVQLGPMEGMVSTHGRPFSLRTRGRGATFNIGFPEAAVRRRLAALLGDDASGPLEFAPTLGLSSGLGNGLARHIHQMMGDFIDGRSIFADTVMAASLEDAMITEMLRHQPNTFSPRLARAERGISPRDVRRALDYIEAHLNSAITIEDVVEASSVPGRSLFRHFQEARGVSPMRFIRDLRFSKARQALLAARPEDSVTAIALQLGFSHLGRFAVEYRRRYGETPSETLRHKLPRI
jgi:AraC-like DNA-binding protein